MIFGYKERCQKSIKKQTKIGTHTDRDTVFNSWKKNRNGIPDN